MCLRDLLTLLLLAIILQSCSPGPPRVDRLVIFVDVRLVDALRSTTECYGAALLVLGHVGEGRRRTEFRADASAALCGDEVLVCSQVGDERSCHKAPLEVRPLVVD